MYIKEYGIVQLTLIEYALMNESIRTDSGHHGSNFCEEESSSLCRPPVQLIIAFFDIEAQRKTVFELRHECRLFFVQVHN